MCGDQSNAIPSSVTTALDELSTRLGLNSTNRSWASKPISGIGENSYGDVLRINWTNSSASAIVKIAPRHPARRAHMRVVDYYTREVFMYEKVFTAYRQLQGDFIIPPTLHASGLQPLEEFLIFEDLVTHGYKQNSRRQLPGYDLVVCAIKALAKLHACSFALQAQQPERFIELVEQLHDNLFTPDIEPVSVEFGKTQLRRTRHMLKEQPSSSTEGGEGEVEENADIIDVLERCEMHFKTLALQCVDGAKQSPYSVICHGDFWNNNILYKHADDGDGRAIDAKLIDFQMSRYAPPVLDLVHYFFACTEKPLRDEHFNDFLRIYYTTLCENIENYGLDSKLIYPSEIFTQQLRDFGIYGCIMGAFSLPFFISEASEIVDIDAVCEAIVDRHDTGSGCSELVEGFDMLTERTKPIFKRRMTDIVRDLLKYDMVQSLQEL